MSGSHHESGVAIIGSSNMVLVHTVDSLPKSGETIFATSYHEHLGGKGNNQAVMISRLTTSSSAQSPKCIFVTGIGNDGFADTLQKSFLRHFPDTNNTTVVKFGGEVTTGRAIINVDKNGHNNIVLLKGANALLAPKHVDEHWSLIEANCKVLVVQNEIPLETTCHALRRGSNSGLFTVFNPAPAPSATHQDLSLLFNRETLSSIDLICPNETEALSLLSYRGDGGNDVGDDDEELRQKLVRDDYELSVEDSKQIAKKLFDKFVSMCPECQHKLQVVITMGGNGSVAYYDPKFSLLSRTNSEERVLEHFPLIEKVEKVVDTTGAGDAFTGSLAYFLSCNVPLNKAIPLASSVASQTVMFHGAQSSYEVIDRSKIKF